MVSPWRKVLYLRQPYPDNHVPPSFLHLLRTNDNVHRPSLSALFLGSLRVSFHLSVVMAFIASFYLLEAGSISPSTLICTSWATMGAIFATVVSLSSSPGTGNLVALASQAKLISVFLMTLLAFAPILRTLTEDVSSDSIYAIAAGLFIGNLLLNDYRRGISGSFGFPVSIATNCAVCGSVVLGSRLTSSFAVFALLQMAVLCFVASPMALRSAPMATADARSLYALMAVTVAAVFVIWTQLEPVIGGIYGLALICISVASPIWIHTTGAHIKNVVYGPWDQAKLVPFRTMGRS
ncbi:phosphatidylinositol N-acetylglucosaminyltransferase subunit C [Blastocladiella britannica]|nr:phosphatidylinositol N-acetylglucosaminyltransferase subunit C [Blastocladiella britannica]